MSDRYTPRPEAQVLVRPLDRQQPRPRSVRRCRPRRRCRRSTPWRMLGEVGAWGVNLHDNDLVPDRRDARPSATGSSATSRRPASSTGLVVPMATVNLFYDPVFRDGAFTANDPRVRAYAVQKTMRAMDLGAELGAKIFVLWGGREGTETDACRRPDEAVKRLREAVNYLCEYSIDREIRLPLRARGQAERAARRHLHGHDRRLPRLHPTLDSLRTWSASTRRSRTRRWRA